MTEEIVLVQPDYDNGLGSIWPWWSKTRLTANMLIGDLSNVSPSALMKRRPTFNSTETQKVLSCSTLKTIHKHKGSSGIKP
jgi:hypothetical protein